MSKGELEHLALQQAAIQKLIADLNSLRPQQLHQPDGLTKDRWSVELNMMTSDIFNNFQQKMNALCLNDCGLPTYKQPPISSLPVPTSKIINSKRKMFDGQFQNILNGWTLLLLEQQIKQTIDFGGEMVIGDQLQQKEKVLKYIDSGILTAKKYQEYVKGMNIMECLDKRILIQETLLFRDDSTLQKNFQGLVQRIRETLKKQRHRKDVGVEATCAIDFDITPSQQQSVLIQNFNKAPESKTKQLFAASYSRLISLIEYYETHMLEKKRRELEEELLPKLAAAMETIYVLNYLDFGYLYVMHLQKELTFEQFHEMTEKQYSRNLLKILTKLRLLLEAEIEIGEDVRNTHRNFKLTSQIVERITTYTDNIKYIKQIQTMKYPFTPLPSFQITRDEYQFLSENPEIQDNQIQFTITNVSGFDSGKLKIYLGNQKDPRVTQSIQSGSTLTTSLKSTNILANNHIRLGIKKKVLLFSVDVLNKNISLEPLLNRSNFKGSVIEEAVKIEYVIKARKARNGISKAQVQVMTLKTYPEYKHTKEYQQQVVNNLLNQKGKGKQAKRYESKHKLFYVERTENTTKKLKELQNAQKQRLSEEVLRKVIKPELASCSLQYYFEMASVLEIASSQYYPYKENTDMIYQLKKSIQAVVGELAEKENVSESLQADLFFDVKLLQLYDKYSLKEFVRFVKVRMEMVQNQLNKYKLQEKRKIKGEPGFTNLELPELFYIPRTLEITKILDSISEPIDGVDVEDIKIPEVIVMFQSKQYLQLFKPVLEKAQQMEMSNVMNGIINKNKPSSEESQKHLTYSLEIQQKVKRAEQRIEENKQDHADQSHILLNESILYDYKLLQIYTNLKLPEFLELILARIGIAQRSLGQKLYVPPFKQTSFDGKKAQGLFQLTFTNQQKQILEEYPADIQFPFLPVYCPSHSYLQIMIGVTTNKMIKQKYVKAKQQLHEEFGELGNSEERRQQYRKGLIESIRKDQLRKEFYRCLELEDGYSFIAARIKVVQEELAKV